MAKIILIFLVCITAVFTMVAPWVGAIAYYCNALMIPNAVWPWVFDGIRVSYYVSLFTLLAFFWCMFSGKIQWTLLQDRQHIFVLLIWVSVIFSYNFNPYGNNLSDHIAFNSDYLLSNYNKLFLMYFVTTLLVNNERSLYFLALAMILTVVFYVYWGNKQYFSGMMESVRLPGPGSIYKDENTFAVLLVTGCPFLYFFGQYCQKRMVRYFIWACIPFAWHVVFLTGSMGGFLGLGAATLFQVVNSRSRLLKVLMPVLLAVAFVSQGGSYLKEKAGLSVTDVQSVDTAQTRFDSWSTGLKMMADHPVTGVGLGNFVIAYPDYSYTRPFVAHNTTIQYAAETGALSAVLFLALVGTFFYRYFKFTKIMNELGNSLINFVYHSAAGGLVGFFICSLFLNLATYELFFYFLLLGGIAGRLSNLKREQGVSI